MQDRVDLDQLEKSDAKRTPGEWVTFYAHKGGKRSGPLVAATAPGHQVLADGHEGGTYPSNDLEHIAAAVNALPALIAELRGLREAGDAVSLDADSLSVLDGAPRGSLETVIAWRALRATKKRGV